MTESLNSKDYQPRAITRKLTLGLGSSIRFAAGPHHHRLRLRARNLRLPRPHRSRLNWVTVYNLSRLPTESWQSCATPN